MIDIWLLFNLFKPFNDILVTTYMDYLKMDEESEINHHEIALMVGGGDNDDLSSGGILHVAPLSRSASAVK